jgi:hypothetical protein
LASVASWWRWHTPQTMRSAACPLGFTELGWLASSWLAGQTTTALSATRHAAASSVRASCALIRPSRQPAGHRDLQQARIFVLRIRVGDVTMASSPDRRQEPPTSGPRAYPRAGCTAQWREPAARSVVRRAGSGRPMGRSCGRLRASSHCRAARRTGRPWRAAYVGPEPASAQPCLKPSRRAAPATPWSSPSSTGLTSGYESAFRCP